MGILRRNKENNIQKYKSPTYKRGITTSKELERELEFYRNLAMYGTATPTREKIEQAEDKEREEKESDKSSLNELTQ